MDEESRRERLERAVRRNKAGRARGPWRERLGQALGCDLPSTCLLPLDETRALKEKVIAILREQEEGQGLGRCGVLEWRADGVSDCCRLLAQHADVVVDTDICMFSEIDSLLGAARARLHRALRHAEEVCGATGDLLLASADANDGLELGLSYYWRNGTYGARGVYALRSWGGLAIRAR